MTKISDLTALTGAGVDSAADVIPIVDASETGTAKNKKITVGELLTLAGGGGGLTNALTWDFNFADAGDAYVRAPTAMTVTEQDTSGTGTIAYEKSTAAAPDTFSSATSPITLEAGAKLKVSASAITGSVAVHLERTA